MLLLSAVPYVAILALILIYGQGERPRQPLTYRPNVTVFIPTFNEEKYVGKKLDDVLTQTYPVHEILILDCSTDSTPAIVREYQKANPNIRLVQQSGRTGMARTLNEALKQASGEIFVYTGCDSLAESRDALERVVSNFSDPKVGAVTGVCIGSGLEGQFRKFTTRLQKAETNIDSTVVAHGGPAFMAVRQSLTEPVREDSIADDTEEFVAIRKKGFKTIVDPTAIAREVVPDSYAARRIQKDRRAQGIVRVLLQNMNIAFNRKYGQYGTVVFPMDIFLLVVSPFLLLVDAILVGYLVISMGPLYLFGLLLLITIMLASKKTLAILDLQIAGLLGTLKAVLGIGSNIWPKERLRPS